MFSGPPLRCNKRMQGDYNGRAARTQAAAVPYTFCILAADMRPVRSGGGFRVRRAAEQPHKEPEEEVHHRHPPAEDHGRSEHHDYNSVKDKFMNELDRLPGE